MVFVARRRGTLSTSMPYASYFIEERSAVVHVGTGDVESAAVLASARGVRAIARATPIKAILVDMTAVTALRASPDDVRELAAVNTETAGLCPHARVAVVAPRDHVYGLARMWMAFMEESGWPVELCRDRDAAIAWLGIDLDPADGRRISSSGLAD